MKFLPLLLVPFLLFGRQKTYDHLEEHIDPIYLPWFTGSLLPPSAVNASPQHPVVAPYIGLNLTYGGYDDNQNFKSAPNIYAINPCLELLFGLNDHIGVDIYASFISSFQKGQKATHFQDTIVLLGFQIAHDTPKTWIPDLRITLQETFPTGNYQKLNPDKLGIDSTGQGSFQTGFNLIAQKLFPINNHFLLLKWSLGYLFPAPVHVKDLNAHGGGRGTRGKVFPGQSLLLYFAGEYSITQKWALAFDAYFLYQAESRFSGNPGHTTDNLPFHMGTDPMFQLSIAPEIEYNITSTSGLLFGVWASVLGRNSPAFVTTVGAYYIAF